MTTRVDGGGGGGGGGGGSESAVLQRSSRRSTSKTMRGAKTISSRGSTRAATNTKNGNDRDRPEHPLSSISRLAAEEAAAGSGRGDLFGTAATRGGGGGAGGQAGRMIPDMSSSHRWAHLLYSRCGECTQPGHRCIGFDRRTQPAGSKTTAVTHTADDTVMFYRNAVFESRALLGAA